MPNTLDFNTISCIFVIFLYTLYSMKFSFYNTQEKRENQIWEWFENENCMRDPALYAALAESGWGGGCEKKYLTALLFCALTKSIWVINFL